jgi:hypothetical protein
LFCEWRYSSTWRDSFILVNYAHFFIVWSTV